mgnify:CR=1 FL=1
MGNSTNACVSAPWPSTPRQGAATSPSAAACQIKARTQPLDRFINALGIRHVGAVTAKDLMKVFRTIEELERNDREERREERRSGRDRQRHLGPVRRGHVQVRVKLGVQAVQIDVEFVITAGHDHAPERIDGDTG